MKTLSNDDHASKQKGLAKDSKYLFDPIDPKLVVLKLIASKLFTSKLGFQLLPMTLVTLVILSLIGLSHSTTLDQSLHQFLLSLLPMARSEWRSFGVLSFYILSCGSLGLLLLRWQPAYQVGVWAFLCVGWGCLSIVLSQSGVLLPIITPILFFGLNGIAISVAKGVRTYLALRQTTQRYALALQAANEGVWEWNLRTDRIYFSAQWFQMIGIDEEGGERVPKIWFDRVHPADLAALRSTLAECLQGASAQFRQEYRLIHRDGSYRWMVAQGLALCNTQGCAERMVGVQTDITQRKRTEDGLRQNALFDKLTGLPNRSGFAQHLQAAIDGASHTIPAFAVLWLDIDCFELINNSLGGGIGDRLLIAVAQRIRSFLSTEDILARIGGDEFGILLNHVENVKDATQTAERIQQVLALPFNLDDREVFLTISIGIALSSTKYTEPDHLLRDADTAMHRAKAFGRARCEVFEQAMRTRMVVKLLLENDFRRVIAQESSDCSQEELQLLYQPIVRLETGEIAGFEALVRWQHPEQGTLPPHKFISMAEETGLIVPMSWWVLRAACRQMRKWQLAFPQVAEMTMNVNLSSRQFAMAGLPRYIEQILEAAELNGKNLKLEITESMIMGNAASIVSVLQEIRSLDIQLAIDDFGTGYSSLSYLTRFPVNTLKIDRSFVSNIGFNSDSLEIIRTIHLLAHNLGMDITAEGVETAEQAACLREMACEFGQGYFFFQPLDADAITTLLAQELNTRPPSPPSIE
jgi:diguanylate cyclase (GGDEF)-like protein/PAS domain S-box-containing protein